MEVAEQIRRGFIVCPHTRQPLTANVPRVKGVPVLVRDPEAIDRYAHESPQMTCEYAEMPRYSWFHRLRNRDYRTRKSLDAFRIFDILDTPGTVGLSIGGGPNRIHPKITNVNIGPFPNVDVIGDAHELPYADESVDVIYCEAVLEHLADPVKAVAEMHRVLKVGGRVYACTPFIHHFHGYPNHFQNFTLFGHQRLFRDFEVEESGSCVGPVYAFRTFVSVFLRTYIPSPWRYFPQAMWAAISMLIGPLDRIIGAHKDAHVLACTTYLVARKH